MNRVNAVEQKVDDVEASEMQSPHPQKAKNIKSGLLMTACCPLMGLTDRKWHYA